MKIDLSLRRGRNRPPRASCGALTWPQQAGADGVAAELPRDAVTEPPALAGRRRCTPAPKARDPAGRAGSTALGVACRLRRCCVRAAPEDVDWRFWPDAAAPYACRNASRPCCRPPCTRELVIENDQTATAG